MKSKTQYSCTECGFNSPKWMGKCPTCEAWNTLVEEKPGSELVAEGSLASVKDEFKGFQTSLKDWVTLEEEADDDKQVSKKDGMAKNRLSTGISELDRVLGGGLVRDSFVLLGGDPGIGKSTLLLQMVSGVLKANPSLKILYVSGEESIEQIRDRASRLQVASKKQVFLASETQLERVFATVKEIRPDILMMDSLQTFSSGYLDSAPGSVSQVRDVAVKLMTLAKSAGISVWLVGHVTKEGTIAGPKTVEHMVDTVLYIEGEGGFSHRLLRAVKNRFGSTRELGVFEMDSEGLREVTNPSALFLSERKNTIPGVAVAVSLEGTRPLLVELQALVVSSALAMPRRTAVGMEASRVSLLSAILERHMRLPLAQNDLFFNVVGGLRLTETACDLAAAAAIWSSLKEAPFPNDWVFIGELGLTGEVRKVSQLDLRLNEAKKLGFKTFVVPKQQEKKLEGFASEGTRVIFVNSVNEIPKLIS
ncbi:DNA repair protein RadA [bacterium]|nr:DNA repair protein RadA [bacterium]